MFLRYCVFFLVVSLIIAEEIVQKTDNGVAESGRNLNDYFTQTADISGWMPQYHTDELAPPLLRRRIRKRKRRPPVITLINDNDNGEIPIRTDEMMEKIRRKSAPIYDDDDNRHTSQKIRDPFTALKEAESKQKATFEEFTTMATTTTTTVDLKTILKQSGGVSLSEILQRKNLTLSELLMGNRAAISALIEKTPPTTTTTTTRYGNDEITTAKYRKIPLNLRNMITRNYEQTSESVESFEVSDVQRKRLASLHDSKDNQIYRDVTKFEVVTDQTTERRVFIPQFDRKMSTEIPIKSKFKPNLPVTSAKLNKLISNKPSTIPPNAIKIDINEIFGYNEHLKKHGDNGPFRMTIDIDNMFENTLKPSITEDKTTQIDDNGNGAKLKPVTAKDEIMEILKNPNDRENLSKILRIRNMTIDELVQQRERGSSQLHLADIFHNETREPEPKSEISISYITQEYFDNFPTNRQSKNQRFSSVVKKELKNPEKIETATTTTTTTTTTTPQPLYTITNFPTYKIESNKNLLGGNQEHQPFLGRIWSELYTDNNADFYKNNHQKDDKITTPLSTIPSIFNDFDDNFNNLQETDRLDLKFNNINDLEVDDDFLILPSGVKSAILASLAIIGGSIFVFLTILMIFKWNQKQKTRLDYNGSFSRTKLRTAILESQQKHRSLKSFMNETLGRKKNYYKAHLHNMSDSIWDNEQKSTF